jgi:nucleotide-binding universal stress UspA family protein
MEVNYGEKILVGVDGSPNSLAALAWALEEGRMRGAPVEAIYAWQISALAYTAPGFIPPDRDIMRGEGQKVLDAALASLTSAPDVKIDARICEGSPGDVLARVSEEPDAGLLVVGARGHGGVAGLLLGSVSHYLTHHCHKPLVVVPRNWGPHPGAATAHLVVGVDGSDGSERALWWAAGEARYRQVPLEAVLVWSLPGPVLPAHMPITPTGGGDMAANVLDVLADLVSKVDTSGVEVKLTVLQGTPARVLTTRACTADLLIVGSRGLGRAREAVSGSVSHSCTHHASIPVAVVPEPHSDAHGLTHHGR